MPKRNGKPIRLEDKKPIMHINYVEYDTPLPTLQKLIHELLEEFWAKQEEERQQTYDTGAD